MTGVRLRRRRRRGARRAIARRRTVPVLSRTVARARRRPRRRRRHSGPRAEPRTRRPARGADAHVASGSTRTPRLAKAPSLLCDEARSEAAAAGRLVAARLEEGDAPAPRRCGRRGDVVLGVSPSRRSRAGRRTTRIGTRAQVVADRKVLRDLGRASTRRRRRAWRRRRSNSRHLDRCDARRGSATHGGGLEARASAPRGDDRDGVPRPRARERFGVKARRAVIRGIGEDLRGKIRAEAARTGLRMRRRSRVNAYRSVRLASKSHSRSRPSRRPSPPPTPARSVAKLCARAWMRAAIYGTVFARLGSPNREPRPKCARTATATPRSGETHGQLPRDAAVGGRGRRAPARVAMAASRRRRTPRIAARAGWSPGCASLPRSAP